VRADPRRIVSEEGYRRIGLRWLSLDAAAAAAEYKILIRPIPKSLDDSFDVILDRIGSRAVEIEIEKNLATTLLPVAAKKKTSVACFFCFSAFSLSASSLVGGGRRDCFCPKDAK